MPPRGTAVGRNDVSRERGPPRSGGRAFSRARDAAPAGGFGLVGKLLIRCDLLADLLERAADQPRDVHLRDPHLLRDLRLGQPLEEAQVEDHALALVECAEPGSEHGAVLGYRVLVLLGADRLERIELALLVGAAAR